MTPLELYKKAGPIVWNARPVTALGTTDFIPENRNRFVLMVIGSDVTVYMQPAIDGLNNNQCFQVANLQMLIISQTEHGHLCGERWRVFPQNNGVWIWGEGVYMDAAANPNVADTPAWEPAQPQFAMPDTQGEISALPDESECQKLLSETALQFWLRMQGTSAAGAGGGESGSDALASASDLFVGD